MKAKITILIMLVLSINLLAQNRVTMIETFTSSTCPPCNPGNVTLEALLANSQNNGKQVSLKYQTNSPGNGDPYYTLEGGLRGGLYSIPSVPNTRIDGTVGVNPNSITQGHLNNAYAIPPGANITATYSVDVPNKTVNIDVTVEALTAIEAGTLLHVAIFEYMTTNNIETNGETKFYHVMKKMLPDANGTILPSLSVGQTFNFTESYVFKGNYRLPANALSPINHAIEHSVEQFDDLGVAVWVQPRGPQLEVHSPTSVSGFYQISTAGFGAAIPTSPITQDLVIFDDNNGDPYDACQAAVNAAQMNGKIVVIRRGGCEFGCKVEAAQNAGAAAVIIVNNVAGPPVGMGAGVCGANVSIPSLMLSQTDGEALISEIESGATVNATLVNKGLKVLQAGYGDLLSGLNEDIIESSVKLYPNPASESTLVSVQLSESQDLIIEVVDMMGQVVYSRTEENVETGRTVHSINTSELADGMYTVKLAAGSTVISKRLVVNN